MVHPFKYPKCLHDVMRLKKKPGLLPGVYGICYPGSIGAGTHEVVFDAGGLQSGTYLYRLETPGGHFSKTVLLVK